MKRLFMLASAMALASCISLLPKPPPAPATFVMSAGEVARLDGAPVHGVVGVAEPTGERSVLGVLLAWRTGDELADVAQTQWSTRAEEALQAMLVETMSRQGRFQAAAREGETASAYEIRWEVTEFDVQQNDMRAHFHADVKLVSGATRQVIAQQLVDASAPVSARSASLAAQALTQAARQGAVQIGVFAANAALAQELAPAPAH